MKKLSLAILILVIITSPALLCAASRTVTITWTIADATNIQEYRVYFADNSSMTNRTLHEDCSAPVENPTNTFTITCNDVDLPDNEANFFTIAAVTGSNESSSSPEKILYIAPVQNLRITAKTQQ